MRYILCGGRGELPSRKLSTPHLLRLERRELRRPWRIAVSKIIYAAPASTWVPEVAAAVADCLTKNTK